MKLERIGLNDYVTVGNEALVEYRGRKGRVLNIKAREALLTFEDGTSAWFFLWHLEPTASPSTEPKP